MLKQRVTNQQQKQEVKDKERSDLDTKSEGFRL